MNAASVKAFTVRCDPKGAPRQCRSDSWRPRECVIRYRRLRDRIRAAAGLIAPFPDSITCAFLIAMPPSWSQRKQDVMAGRPHRAKPDIDNLVKGVLDALLQQDGCVHGCIAHKHWCREGEQRIEVMLEYAAERQAA